jgi:hypothetical protein
MLSNVALLSAIVVNKKIQKVIIPKPVKNQDHNNAHNNEKKIFSLPVCLPVWCVRK